MKNIENIIRIRIENSIKEFMGLDCQNISFELKGGLVNLEGKVGDDDTWYALRDIVFKTEGVEAVNNYIYIDPFQKLKGVA